MATKFFVGNLVTEPKFSVTENGTSKATFRLAENDTYRDEHGEWRHYDATFWDVYAWRITAEHLVNAGLKKGESVLLEARTATHKWETENGEQRSRVVLHLVSIGRNITRPLREAQGEPPHSMDTSWGEPPNAEAAVGL